MATVLPAPGLGALVIREIAPQSLGSIMGLLGYPRESLDPPARPATAAVPIERIAPRRVPYAGMW